MKKTFIITLIILLGIVLTGCLNPANSELDAFIRDLQRTPVKEAGVKSTIVAESTQELSPELALLFEGQHEGKDESSGYNVTYKKYEPEGGFSELMNYGQYDSILFPGAIVDIRNTEDIVPIGLEQSPITLSISTQSTTAENSYRPYVMRQTSLSASRTAVNKLVNNSLDSLANIPVRTQISGGEVTNLYEFGVGAGIGFNFSKFGISGDVSYQENKNQKVIYLQIHQIYYTIDIDAHNNPSQYFSNRLDNAEVMEKLEGTSPAIVSSVSYGRLAVIKITSRTESEKISGAASVSSIFDLGEVSGEIDTLSEQGDVDIQAFIFGGSLGNDSQLVSANNLQAVYDEFNNFEPDVAQALPIAFELRYLSDFSGAKIALAGSAVYVKEVKPE